ncbi:MAG: class I SAM-dependent methyltransferase [Betaproteobacteria bacterium]|nr:MAG: class I SAM-dependent methyltransferase [Betaproteobacteria bacterium]TAG76875.1 MAG: class I SAM-dependent methyltransferase [Betaproteobacteria bacterium]
MAAPTRRAPPVISATRCAFSRFVTLHPSLNTKNSGLPAPSAEAAAHSARLTARLVELIAASPHGAIAFVDFMRALLYEPGLGYYAAGSAKFGEAGDFVTAPELSPLFGRTLARAFSSLGSNQVLELGAGSGALAESFLQQRPDARYQILEVSADLRERQQARLAGKTVNWLDALPERIEGLVLLNEVLDAIPCELIRYANGRYQRAWVRWLEGSFSIDWVGLPKGPLYSVAATRIPQIEGYVTEFNPEAEALVATLSQRLDPVGGGALCMIDYGFARREYYMPTRSTGTLACHYRHRVHFDPLAFIGLQDVTAHIDFTAMAEAAVDNGASVGCFTTQANFLLRTGLLNSLEVAEFSSDKERIIATSAVQKLVSPAEMGELFKVLVVTKGQAADQLAAFAEFDESYRL